MKLDRPERRKEPRIRIEAKTTVEVNDNERVALATTVDMSGCGVRLRFEEPHQLVVDDEVICDFKIASGSYWAVGNVVRIDGCEAAIDLKGGSLFSPEPGKE